MGRGVLLRFFGWVATHPFQAALNAIVLTVVAGSLYAMQMKPRNDRHWKDYLALTPHVAQTTEGFSVAPVNDWSYSPAGPTDKTEVEFKANFADLRNVWFVLEPMPDFDWLAHTFLLFEFSGDRIVAVNIEARQEEGETFSPFEGLFNAYELLFSWGTSRDALLRRTVFLDHGVQIYPLKLSEKSTLSLLRNFLKTTSQLETKPRFYNTLFHNCTNELGKEAKLKWNVTFVLTGKSPNFLYLKGLIPGSTLEVAKQRADMTAWLKAHNGTDKMAFDAALLEELRARGTH